MRRSSVLVDIIKYRSNPYQQAPKDTTAGRLIRGQVFTSCQEFLNLLPNRIGRHQVGGIPGMQAANARRFTDAAYATLIERHLHSFFTQ